MKQESRAILLALYNDSDLEDPALLSAIETGTSREVFIAIIGGLDDSDLEKLKHMMPEPTDK